MTARVDNCCGDPSHCGGCSVMGNYRRAIVRSSFTATQPMRGEIILLPTLPAAPKPARKVRWIERLISGPQGDPSLREDFLSFLGCLACGVGLALLLIALMAAGHFVLDAQP